MNDFIIKRKRARRWKWIGAGLCVVLALAAYLAASRTALLPAFARLPAPHPRPAETRDARWRQDLNYLASELPRLHVNAFHHLARDEFERAVVELDAAIPTLSDRQVVVELGRLVAMVGEGHTRAVPPATVEYHLYPLQLYWFKDGIYVVDAMPRYNALIGTRVLQVNGVEVERVCEALRPLIAHENEAGFKNRVLLFVLCPEMLADLGLAQESVGGRLLIENGQGERFESEVDAVLSEKYDDYFTDPDNAWSPSETPLYLEHRGQHYWFEYLPDEQAVYVQFNRCAEMNERPFRAFNEEVFAWIDAHPVQRLVIDLRHNGGGDSSLFAPFIERLAGHPLNREGQIDVIVGRRTFSSAVLNALELGQKTNATFIGEPTSGSPNHYGQVSSFVLPNSKIRVDYSTKYFGTGIFGLGEMNVGDWLGALGYASSRFPVSDPTLSSLVPEQVIELTGPDYLSGRDPVLEAILK